MSLTTRPVTTISGLPASGPTASARPLSPRRGSLQTSPSSSFHGGCPPEPPWGSDAHLEIYSGLPGFDGSGGNVLFRSSRIDFESLPIVAVITPQGEDSLYIGEVKASNLGLVKPIPVTVDSIYRSLSTTLRHRLREFTEQPSCTTH